jgi:hypothetical protein
MKNILAFLIGGILLAASGVAAQPEPTLSKKEVRELTAKASTPDDHHRLAQYYERKAKEYDAEAKEHADMARIYRANPSASEIKRPGSVGTVAHCERLSHSLTSAAAEARGLAVVHEQLATK